VTDKKTIDFFAPWRRAQIWRGEVDQPTPSRQISPPSVQRVAGPQNRRLSNRNTALPTVPPHLTPK